jgi:hypothetical protein
MLLSQLRLRPAGRLRKRVVYWKRVKVKVKVKVKANMKDFCLWL